ncbi:APC family permease [Anaeromyxobacter sp. Fw109-5]|uniref:APC family permease n=1 Tax=Anaeromyxobacter sp. (strain Fw109-5) TaxID=404589 RepID=UPI0000ED8046|nr:APC family permease [Anaeromyxobacter sp. Fw109-5]ABS27109.1 amino acid permease-associated region [Anaeromyxobacter sp. Fw109-5]
MGAGGTSARRGDRDGAPRPSLARHDAIALVLGIVIGAGIFRAPSAVAASAPDAAAILAAWIAGGVVSLAGAMCYAELAAAYPHAGGDYHFLTRALGRPIAFLFAWARLTVIPTGSVAMLGFVFGDYAADLLGAPRASGPLAAALVVTLTLVNAAGLRVARRLQNLLTVALVLGLVAVIVTGFALPPAPPAAAHVPARPAFGLAMVFVLLAYGGWNEAAYVSTELRGGRRAIAITLVVSLLLVTVLYVLANVAYLRGLGVDRVRESSAVAADLLARGLGPAGAAAIAAIVIAAAVTSANATLLMGSRLVWAFGRDFPLFGSLGRWSERASSPVNAVLLQGAIALALVGLGTLSRRGFEAMVAYTAPVFWLFFLLTGISLFVLRRRDPAAARPFRVPLYPATPAVFCAACAFLLWSSLVHAGPGAIAGVAVLATGLAPMWLSLRRAQARPSPAA